MRKATSSKVVRGKTSGFLGVRAKGGSVEVVHEVVTGRGARLVRTVSSPRSPAARKGAGAAKARDWLADESLGDELLSAFRSAVKRAKDSLVKGTSAK
jgi:hypothetical protein